MPRPTANRSFSFIERINAIVFVVAVCLKNGFVVASSNSGNKFTVGSLRLSTGKLNLRFCEYWLALCVGG